MWNQLGGVGGGSHDDEDDEDNHHQSGGGLWSRFKQVAAEVATDLAQPQWEDDEDADDSHEEEEEEKEDEADAAWDEFEQQQEYYPEGEEEAYQDDDYVEEGDAWAEEEEVDFGTDEAPPAEEYPNQEEAYYEQQEQAEQQPLFQQPLIPQEENAPADVDEYDWDLDDGDLGIPAEENAYQEEQPEYVDEVFQEQFEYAEEPELVDEYPAAEEENDNAWGRDDIFNFDDSPDAGVEEVPDAEPDEIIGQPSLDTYETAEQHQQQDASGWSDDLGFPEEELPVDSTTDEHEISHESYYSAEHQHGEEVYPNSDEADAWGDDDLNLSEHIDPETTAEQQTLDTAIVPPSDLNASANVDTGVGDAWDDDDLNLSDHDNKAQPSQPKDLIEGEAVPAADLNASANIDTGAGNAWDDDLNLSDHDNEAQPSEPEAALPADLNASVNIDTGVDDNWDDDLNLSDHDNEAQPLEPEAALRADLNASSNIDTGVVDTWDDDLNLSDHDNEAQPSEHEAALPADLNASANIDTGVVDTWDDDLNLSDHDNEAQPSEPEAAPAADLNASTNINTGADDTWDDDLNLSDHNDDAQPLQSIEAEQTTEADRTNTGSAWYADLNLGSPLYETQPLEPIGFGSATITAADRATAGAAWHTDLNLSSPIGVPQAAQPETELPAVNASANDGDAWDDDVNLSEHLEEEAEARPTESAAEDPSGDLNASANDGDAWDDDVNLSEHLEEEAETQPTEFEAAEPSGDLDASANDGDAWDDDVNLSEHLEKEAETQPTESAAADPSGDLNASGNDGDAWDDDVNLSEHLEEEAETQPTGFEAAEPSGDLNASGNDGDAWDDDVNLSEHLEEEAKVQLTESAAVAPPGDLNASANDGDAWDDDVILSEHLEEEAETQPTESAAEDPSGDLNASGNDDDAWDPEPDLNEGSKDSPTALSPAEPRKVDEQHEDDDSTVEQSNTAGWENEDAGVELTDELQQSEGDATSDALNLGSPERPPSRRATLRVSNKSSAVSGPDQPQEVDTPNEKIVGTSVMFADQAVGGERSADETTERSDDLKRDGDSLLEHGVTFTSSDLEDDEGANVDTRMIRDNLSSVSEDSTDGPKPLLETQISMMTLKSVADSCPSRQHGNDSDEDDEQGFGPVVDKTPEISSEKDKVPAQSTMTINSTAVEAHSVNEDIQQDEDMEGTYYGGSTTDGGPSGENAWEEDDASSLEGMNDLEEKIVNFELSETNDDSTPQGEAAAEPLTDQGQEKVAGPSPRMNSSMTNVYSDDNSVPSRDKDDDDEDVYKPVVDQVPKPIKNVSETVSAKQDEDTDGILTGGTPTDREHVDDEENGWDEQGSLDGLSEGDADHPGKETSSTTAAGQVVVENTPDEEQSEGSGDKAGASLAAVESTDNSCPSRVHDSDEEQYGLVVDQIPDSPSKVADQMSVAASSMAVVAHREDLKQDDDLDASENDGSVSNKIGDDGWDDDVPALENIEVSDLAGEKDEEGVESATPVDELPAEAETEQSREADRVVDLTPRMEPKKLTRLSSNSLAVMAHSVNQDFEDEDEEEDDDANFGPIVDITPNLGRARAPMTPSSTAVLTANLKEDFKQDETTDVGIGEVDWDDECPELEDLQLGEEDEEEEDIGREEAQPVASNLESNQREVVMVDHTPEGETLRKHRGDASLAVLAPSEADSCPSINDEDDTVNAIDPNGEHINFGPVVDMTPTLSMQRTPAPSTAPSVTFSLAVEACSVDEDIKQDEEMDETLAGDTTTCGGGADTGWDEDTRGLEDTDHSISHNSEPSGYRLPLTISQNPEQRVMVDHTPQLSTSRPRVADASLATLAPSLGSTYHTEENEDENDNDTITNDEDVYGQVVDHTPRLAPVPLIPSNSMAVAASSADFRSELERDEDMDNTFFGDSTDGMDDGWEDDDQATQEVEDGGDGQKEKVTDSNVVDHTPTPIGKPKDPSVAVLVPSEDSSSVVDDDNDSQDAKHVFGPVVDVTPEVPSGNATVTGSLAVEAHSLAEDIRRDEEMEGTMFGDSTSAGGGWDDEEDMIFEDLGIDEYKEAEDARANPSNSIDIWQPNEAVSDNASSSHMEGSTSLGKTSQDGLVLVDHTPSEIDSTMPKNSVGWLLNVESGISEDNDTDEVGDGWAEDDPEVEDGDSPDQAGAGEDQVVDHVPNGAASRFGDASTLVVADPSEVLSHVDDMLQEEGNFGPVVDQTPPSQPSLLPHGLSGAGSTAVVAPTIVHDELDDGDESGNDGEDAIEDGWDADPSELEQAPNPQSGNEEEQPPRVREQVVDFLPPPESVTDQNRGGWSEVTTGGVPSVLLADPKEDEFGPVVDQLPLPHPSTLFSALSTASQVASSECEALAEEDEREAESKQDRSSSNVVVDPLPRPFEISASIQNLDSTASLVQSSGSEDEDDDDATGKYGPVVDHLPSTRSSLPPSRGGSTVDALATVSEVNDDDDGNSIEEGDNDGWDDDLGDIDVSEHQQAVTSPTSNLDPVVEPAEEPEEEEKGMTVRFRSVVAAIFDPSSNATEGLAEEEDVEGEDTGEENAWGDDFDGDDFDFDGAMTPPATPYSQPKAETSYLEAGEELPEGVALPDFDVSYAVDGDQCNSCGDATTIDCPCVQRILMNGGVNGDNSIMIDYQMLLQTEISKRRLVEEESNDLRAQLETLKESRTAGEVNMETVQTLQEYVKGVEEKLRDVGEECELLRNQNQELQSSLNESQTGLAQWAQRESEWKSKESDLREEIDRTGQQLKQALSESTDNLETREKYLLAEIDHRDESAQKLTDQIGELQVELSNLRNENHDLVADVNALKESLSQKDEERERLISKESTYEQEIQNLRSSFEELEREHASNVEYREKFGALQEELATKGFECEKLAAELETLKELEEASESREQDNSVSEMKIKILEGEVKKITEEKEMLEEKLRDMPVREEALSSELQSSLDQNSQELQLATAKVSALKEHNANLDAELSRQRSIAESTERLETELHSVSEERDGLRSALAESNETIQELRHRVEEQGTKEAEIEQKRNKEAELLKSQLTSLRNVIDANKKQIEALQKKSERVSSEKQSLQDEIAEWKSKCKSLEESIESIRLTSAEEESRKVQDSSELESLRHEVASFATEREEAEKERERLLQQSSVLESSLNEARAESESNAAKVEELEEMLSTVQADVDSLRQEYGAIKSERDEYLAKFNAMEQSMAGASQSSQEASRLAGENASMSSEIQRLQQELDNREKTLQNFESRTASLEAELTSERESGYEKDEDLAELRRQLEETLAHLEETSEGQGALPERIAELEDTVSNLKAERDEREKSLAVFYSKEQELQEISQSLSQDKEAACQERDAIAEENEDMLVQFGYLNEQIDSYNQQIQELSELVERYQLESETSETRLRDMQRRLEVAENARMENGDHHASRADQAESEAMHLRQEQNKLLENLDELTTSIATKDEQIKSMTEELEDIRYQLGDLDHKKRDAEAAAREKEELRSQIESLEIHRSELNDRCTNLEEELSRTNNMFDASQNNSSALQNRVESLERVCSERDYALQQKDAEMRDLMNRLHEASGESGETQEMVMMRERLNQMENSAIENADRVNETERRYEASQEELKTSREKLTSMENTIEELEGQLITQEENARNTAQQESLVSELENKLHDKARAIADLTSERAALSREIDTLKSQLSTEQERSQSAEEEKRTSSETEALRDELTSLQNQIASSKEEENAREESRQTELRSLQRKLASKDGEIMMLKRKLESATEELQDSRGQVKASQELADRMKTEMEGLKAQQGEVYKGRSSTATKLLQQSKENAEDVDNLRSTVISLAAALETSEVRRADAIDRLLKERETHAESLRRLADSVRRFYTTMS